MAFVVAQRGKTVVKVSAMTYKKHYKNKGFVLVGEKALAEVQQEQTILDDVEFEDTEFEEQDNEEEVEEESLETIPISEMKKEQLMEYAKQNNIDTSSAKNVREAREIIQKAIQERNS